MPQHEERLKIAIVGCGVAGLTAGWLLSRKHDVHFFERNNYIGGHTRTLKIADGEDAGTAVDTGFIVMNERNYPLFTRVLEQLKVETEDSSMTFSFCDRGSGYAYSGNSIGSLFPSIGYFFKKNHLSLLRDLWRFAKIGYTDLNNGYLKGKTLGAYCADRRFGNAFLRHYLYPMGAAIWSSPIAKMQDFPAEPYLHFLENHGLLRLTNRPQWKYVKGGSRTYVEAILRDLKNAPQTNAAPDSIQRTSDGVRIKMRSGEILDYDHVVIGTHADEALKLLEDPSETEKENLGPWNYQANSVVLHTSPSHLPPSEKLWSSWNFISEPGQSLNQPVSVSYYMNRLQNLKTSLPYVVTLNAQTPIPEKHIVNETVLTHPLYSFESMATQAKLTAHNGERNTWFCGSYFGYGFHEDAVHSAVKVANGFGIEL